MYNNYFLHSTYTYAQYINSKPPTATYSKGVVERTNTHTDGWASRQARRYVYAHTHMLRREALNG